MKKITIEIKIKTLFCALFILSVGLLSSFGQDEVTLQDHKPLLGEIHYGNRVGGVQAQEGKSIQIIAFEETDVLKCIQVFLNERKVVAGFMLEVEKKDGIKVFSFGNINEIAQEKFVVTKNRKLVGICGASGWYIDRIQFVFDDGTMTPRYGGPTGDLDFKLVLNKKPSGKFGRLMGFWGSHTTNSLETIGLVFWPIE